MNEPTADISETEPGPSPKALSKSAWSDYASLIPKLVGQYDFFRERLANRKKLIRRWRSRFEHDAAEFDTRTEKERATRPFMLDPHMYTNIMAMVTHLVDQFMASSPQLKVRGRGYEDKGDAALERLLAYDLTEANPAADWVGGTFRRAAIEGIAINRMRYVDEMSTVKTAPSEADKVDYAAAVAEASATVGQPPSDPGEYALWADEVRKATGKPLPPMPIGAPMQVAGRSGVVIDQVSLDDVEWDPTLPTIDQPDQCIWYRNYVRRDVLLAMAERLPGVWDKEAILSLPKESKDGYKSGSDIRKASLAAMGIKDDGCDPLYDDVICLKQRWCPRASELRYLALGNDTTPLTVDPNFYPTDVIGHPFFGFMNVPTDGASVGISEYQPNGLLNDWLDQLQSMQLYWMALAVFQPMAVAAGSNLKAILEDNCIPGGIVELDDFDDVKPLFEKFNNQTPLSENMLQILRGGLDRATGINETTRGEQATLNRVTGAEFLGRQGSMQVRMKDRLYRFGTTLGNMARFGCALRFQFGKREHLANIAGLDPFLAYNRSVLVPGISSDYIFTPASASADSGLQAQQIGELAKFLQSVGALVPGGAGMMQLTLRYLQAMRIPGAEEVAKALQGDAAVGKQIGELQGQIASMTSAGKLMQTENDALRRKLTPPIPPAAEIKAETDLLQLPAPPTGLPAPADAAAAEDENPAENAAEGGLEEPDEVMA